MQVYHGNETCGFVIVEKVLSMRLIGANVISFTARHRHAQRTVLLWMSGRYDTENGVIGGTATQDMRETTLLR